MALDTVTDASLLIPTIAQTLRVPEKPGRPIAVTLAESLAAKRTLLVLDNLEQVVAGAPEIAALLAATTAVAVLGSSREPLAIAGEHVYPVPPLGLPAEPGTPTAADLVGAGGGRSVHRARPVRPGRLLTRRRERSGRCSHLPAPRWAAARDRARCGTDQRPRREPDPLAPRSSADAFWPASRRDLPERQRTLRGAIDWSHDLLSEPEQHFFRRFSVFAGGADVDAVSAVIDPDGALGVDALDLASGLVDRSLLRSTRGANGSRLDMLETIREYAAERLAESTEGT